MHPSYTLLPLELSDKIALFKETLNETLAVFKPDHTVSTPRTGPLEADETGWLHQNVLVDTCCYRLRFRFGVAAQDARLVTQVKMDYALLDGTIPPPDPGNPDVRVRMEADREDSKQAMAVMAMVVISMDEPPASQTQPRTRDFRR